MGLSSLCCLRPRDVNPPEIPSGRLAPAESIQKSTGPEYAAAHTPGGRTLLVTAQSGSARELESYLARDTSDVKVGLSVPLPPTPEVQTKFDHQKVGPWVRNLGPSAGRAEVTAARSDSCPVGELQRPPNSLLEASLRRRQRDARPQVRPTRAPDLEPSLDEQQLTTIRTFMAVYEANLDGKSSQLVEEISPLLAEALSLRAHDGKVYHGREAALRRLQHGTSCSNHSMTSAGHIFIYIYIHGHIYIYI